MANALNKVNSGGVEDGSIVNADVNASAAIAASKIAGLAAAATTGTAAAVTVADESSDTTCFPLFVTAATGDLALKTGTNLAFNSSTGEIEADIIKDSKGDVRSIPKQTNSGSHTLAATSAGQVLYTDNNTNVNDSVFSAGDAVTIINNSGSSQTITQGSGVTMYNTADATTGNRTLASRGMATIWFADASTAYITGAGLS
jgi:hypothetical protein